MLDSGSRQVVLVDKGEGRFEPREVKLGRRGGGYVEISDGVDEGDAVVTSANFLIDAESNLKAALKGFAERGSTPSDNGMGERNDRPRHRLVGPQPVAGAVRHGICGRGRPLCPAPSAARCHSRSLRHPGHRLHRVPGAGAAGDRGSGHLSADDGDADRAEVEGGARLLLFRRLLRLRYLRRRHRHLLGALAGSRIPQRRGLPIAGRRDADDRSRRDRRRLGIPVRSDVQGIEPGRHARDPGLESEVRARQGGRRRRSRQRRRLRQAVQRDPRSAADARSRHHDAEDARRHPRQQRRRRRPHRRIVRIRVRDPRQGLPEEHQRSRQHRAQDREAARRSCCATSRASNSAPTSGAVSPNSTAREKSQAASCCSALA